MTWDDVEDVLFDGTQEEVGLLRCPECSGKILFEYDERNRSFLIKCVKCGYLSKSHGVHYKPNCVKFLGYKHMIN